MAVMSSPKRSMVLSGKDLKPWISEGYSIIGQGRIDEILSLRSADRREIFLSPHCPAAGCRRR